MTYYPTPCRCGHQSCKDWHVSDVAQVQGVHFTKEEAFAVAKLMNKRERHSILIAALKQLSECDGTPENVASAEILAVRVRAVASEALKRVQP